ncbi:peptidoglycan/LPS O-acetylase OafA/YrhL [Ewingella americana]
MQKASKQRFIGLEWLRFLLGCYVMVYHTFHQYPQRGSVPFLAELTSMGFFATSTFFVLSGFSAYPRLFQWQPDARVGPKLSEKTLL